MSIPSAYETTDDLVLDIINATRLPISQVTFTPQALIRFMDQEQKTTITQLVHSIREDYWVQLYDQQVTTGVFAYKMWPRSVGGALVDFVFVDASGNEIQIANLDTSQLKSPSYFAYRPSWQGQGAYLQNDMVMLWPQTFNNTAYKLRQKFERRPNTLTQAGDCVQVSSINTSTNTITLTMSPPGWAAGQLVDVIDNNPQFVSQNDNLLISNVVGAVLTIDPSTPISTTIMANMWICPAGTTCVPQIPVEAYPLLMARGGLRVAAAMGNSNAFNVFSKMCEDAANKVEQMLTPRVKGQPKKFVNKNTINYGTLPYYR